MALSNGTTSTPPKLVVTLPSPQHSTLQWHHHVHSPKVGRPPPNHSTLEWHPAMTPSNGTTSSPPKLAVTLPSLNHSTLQWHSAMAPRPLLPVGRHPSLPQPQHTTMAFSNGTTSSPPKLVWHPAMAPRPLQPAMAPWCHVQSAKVVRRLPPLLRVRTL